MKYKRMWKAEIIHFEWSSIWICAIVVEFIRFDYFKMENYKEYTQKYKLVKNICTSDWMLRPCGYILPLTDSMLYWISKADIEKKL